MTVPTIADLIEEARDFTSRMTGQPWACELIERLLDALGVEPEKEEP